MTELVIAVLIALILLFAGIKKPSCKTLIKRPVTVGKNLPCACL